MINPMCDMDWSIYLDFLADQGFDELRDINVASLICHTDWLGQYNSYHNQCYGDSNFGPYPRGNGENFVRIKVPIDRYGDGDWNESLNKRMNEQLYPFICGGCGSW